MPDVAGHPNRLPFRGVLTLVGVASQRSPSGARGHRVMLTRAATEAGLPSLLGMALDYVPSLDAHDARRKIGIITEANIVSMPQRKTSIQQPARSPIRGYLFAHDFPDVVKEIQRNRTATPWHVVRNRQYYRPQSGRHRSGPSPISLLLAPRCCAATRPPIRKPGLLEPQAISWTTGAFRTEMPFRAVVSSNRLQCCISR